jgi:hypothetical protein
VVVKEDDGFHRNTKMLQRLAMENVDFSPACIRKGIKRRVAFAPGFVETVGTISFAVICR